jgi:hypothetical protein
MNDKPACIHCQWFDRISKSELAEGYCRVKPPLTWGEVCKDATPVSAKKAFWPIVEDDDWCGSFDEDYGSDIEF